MRILLQTSVAVCVVFGSLISLCHAQLASPATSPGKIRIVGCDDHVVSQKRGICANHLDPADFKALAPGVSWFYNWNFEAEPPPAGLMEFLPMTWGNDPQQLAGLERYLNAGHKPRAVLAINEPNLNGQAFITPEQTAELLKQIKTVADRHGIPTVGPHMALGTPPGKSIVADDPLTHQRTTYTFMVPFLKSMQSFGKPNLNPAGVGIHVYGNTGELKWAVDLMKKEFHQPVWVTEYAFWDAPDAEAERIHLIQATDLLERSPDVAGYAWFKERLTDNPKLALFAEQPGKLTPLGEAYVNLPPHDADLYYRLPGRLQAENYVAVKNMEIWPTTDVDGFTEMRSTEDNATVDCNVQVDQAGRYKLNVRVSGLAGGIELLANGKTLGRFDHKENGWEKIQAVGELKAGPQRIQIKLAIKRQAINWIEFAN